MTGQPTAKDGARFYSGAWSAAVLAALEALPAGAPALGAEIAALRVLLLEVAEEATVPALTRLGAFCKGADSLGRLYRVRHTLEQATGAGGGTALDALLDSLGLGPRADPARD